VNVPWFLFTLYDGWLQLFPVFSCYFPSFWGTRWVIEDMKWNEWEAMNEFLQLSLMVPLCPQWFGPRASSTRSPPDLRAPQTVLHCPSCYQSWIQLEYSLISQIIIAFLLCAWHYFEIWEYIRCKNSICCPHGTYVLVALSPLTLTQIFPITMTSSVSSWCFAF
jgi:hypothetical protein